MFFFQLSQSYKSLQVKTSLSCLYLFFSKIMYVSNSIMYQKTKFLNKKTHSSTYKVFIAYININKVKNQT